MSQMISVVFIALIFLPPTFKDKPPKNGLILQTGGVMSTWSAYVVDFDSATMRFYETDGHRIDAHNDPEKRKLAGTRKLDPKIISNIRALANQAIADHYFSSDQTYDFDIRLEVSKNGKITETQTGGPADEKQRISSLLILLREQFAICEHTAPN